jgi:formyltetrahydrofolate deformylase
MSDTTNANEQIRSAILLIHCPDRRGLVASVTEFIYKNRGNILYLEQHVDPTKEVFFMRVEWDLEKFAIPADKIGEYFQTLIADKFGMEWMLHFSYETPRVAVFVSRLPHCLYDLLSRSQYEGWNVEIPLIISNHPYLKPIADRFGIDYRVFPITKETKREREEEQLALLKERDIDFIVLARYMQILTDEFIYHYPNRIINIHHAFLPAFPGARPYHSAHQRGVKIIGATSHYVTAELDAGPIIEQDVVRVSHQDRVKDLVRKGQDLEKVVLSRAVWYHLKRKILVYDNRTIVFA